MNALTLTAAPRPTLDEPIPTLAGTPGLTLLRSNTAGRLATTATAAERADLIEAARVIYASLTPARPEEVAVHIEALALHFPTLRRTDAEHRVANRHWVEDLAGWPADLIGEACRQWRNSAKDRFPTPGQLKAQVQAIFDHRRLIGKRADDFLRVAGEGAQGAPRDGRDD